MEPEDAFGVVLRKLRHERELSQEALALDADLQRNYISLLERGANSASLKTIFKLAQSLGISPADLVRMVESELHKASRTRQRRS